MNLQRLACTLFMMTTMALAGCGGGGGGSMPSVSVLGDLTVTQEVADNVVTAMGKAAEATPRAGSVTQSSNVDSNGVTTDQVAVTAEYGASVPRFSIRNEMGAEWSIGMDEGNPRPISDTTSPWKGAGLNKRVDGGTVYVDAYTDIDAPAMQQIGGDNSPMTEIVSSSDSVSVTGSFDPHTKSITGTFNGQHGQFLCQSSSCRWTESTLTGDWTFAPDSPDTDYLAGGVWLFVPNDDATSADEYVFGAFVDGNDPFRQSDIMALEGMATYEGGATGVYSEKTDESTSIDFFNGDVELTADFGGGSVLGTISGSITNFEVDGKPDVGMVDMLSLGTAPIGSENSGFFKGIVSGSDDERMYEGNWGGQFYGNGDGNTQPGSVAGTFGGSSTDDAVNFVGAFGAHKQ